MISGHTPSGVTGLVKAHFRFPPLGENAERLSQCVSPPPDWVLISSYSRGGPIHLVGCSVCTAVQSVTSCRRIHCAAVQVSARRSGRAGNQPRMLPCIVPFRWRRVAATVQQAASARPLPPCARMLPGRRFEGGWAVAGVAAPPAAAPS